jgi:hypothetical protein
MALASVALLTSSAEASASTLLSKSVTAPAAAERSCTSKPLSGKAVATDAVTTPALGFVRATVHASSGDWDIAVLDAASGRTVAGAATRGPDDIAEGFAAAGERLIVQACRLSGSDSTADVSADFTPIPTDPQPTASMVRVATRSELDTATLVGLGLDVAESAGDGYADVISYGPDDLETIRRAGLSYQTLVPNLAAQSVQDEAANRSYAKGKAPSGLPSGQDTYRRLFDYSEDMKTLAKKNKGLVRYFKLRFHTYEDRPVEAIEIASHVRRKDGRPVFLQMGVHHAREWPSGEHAMEWAFELVKDYKHGNKRVRKLVRHTRTIVVPIVNPDGFNTSREAGEMNGAGDGRGPGDDTPNLVIPYEYQRKNCRYAPPMEDDGGSCTQMPATGLEQFGVDPNRNYGGFWGGPGASPPGGNPPGEYEQDYRGPGPFSEPETKNIRKLISGRQVTGFITNHTFSDLVLRPPGIQAQGKPVDNALYKKLGDSMAAENGYTSQPSWKLYDTTGSTEDWAYYATGSFGFTFEIGCNDDVTGECVGNFHPPFAQVVDQYNGTSPEATEIDGGGNRAAYFKAMRFASKARNHSLLEGTAPPGAKLILKKRFMTATSHVVEAGGEVGKRMFFRDKLRSAMKVNRHGHFHWHINPSTRPVVAQPYGRPTEGPPSDPIEFSGDASTTTPCADYDTEDPGCWNDHPFTVPSGAAVDNAKATVKITWSTPASDWDMKVFVDSDNDGSSEGETNLVGSSGNSASPSEQAQFVEPKLQEGEHYVVRVQNYAAVEPYDGTVTFDGPDKARNPQTETWTLVCRNGGHSSRQHILVGRGVDRHLDLTSRCS